MSNVHETLQDVFKENYGENWQIEYRNFEHGSGFYDEVITALERVRENQIEELLNTLPSDELIADIINEATVQEIGIGVKPFYLEQRIKGAKMIIKLLKVEKVESNGK
jgi:hypothetical protein